MPYYQVNAWSRVQNASGDPTFVELGPVTVTGGEEGAGLAWSRELFQDGSITCATLPSKMIPSVAERIRDMIGKPMELSLHRDGVLVQRGPLVAWQIEGNTLILNARGLLYYCRYMALTSSVNYSTNQVLIAKALIDHHQAKSYGNFGLDTSNMTSAGSSRTRKYLATELINVMEEIHELGAADDGFEIDIDPGSRLISCYNPTKGTDKSGSVILDARGMVSPSFSNSVGAGQFGTAALVAGIVNDDVAKSSNQINTTTRNTFGLAYVTHSSIGVPNTTELNQVAVKTLEEAQETVFIPPHDFWSLPDASVDDFTTGDKITVEYDSGFGMIDYAGRVKNLFISVQEGGQDKLTVEFV